MVQRSSAQRKLTRGIEQVQALCQEAVAFENRAAYVLRCEEKDRTSTEVRYECFVSEIEPPPDDWPLRVGEAVQNRPMLKGVPGPIRTLIEGSQPYRVLPDAPSFDALERLRTLSNIDKHRELHTVAGVVDVEYVGVPDGITVRWKKLGTNRVLEHGETHISTLIATVEDPAKAKIEDVDVNPGFSYQARIEGRPLGDLVPVYNRVFRAVGEVETGQPPPFGAYP